MKTLRTLGMAFTAILMTMGFAACSDDDNEGGQPGTPGTSGKQLVRWHESNDEYMDLHYGDDGWLARAYSSEGSDRDVIYIHENDGANIPQSPPMMLTKWMIYPGTNSLSTTCCAGWMASRANTTRRDT